MFEIIIFPESGAETEESIIAERDERLSISIISKATLDKLAVGFHPCSREPDTGSENKLYSTIGKVVLRWHEKDSAKSYSETFYVANIATPAAILGATANLSSKEPTINPVGLEKQTAGIVNLPLLIYKARWGSAFKS
jgi:hypothetical protein